MLTLITYPAGFGTLSVSPFCVEAMYLLNAAQVDWQREDSVDPRRMPRGTLPVLRTAERLIHDSDGIRRFLEENGADFTAGLSMLDRARTRALVRMAEEHLYHLLMLDRWERAEIWPAVRDTYFAEIPKPLRALVAASARRSLLQGLQSRGPGRLSWDERLARLEQDLEVIEVQLGNSAFLFGEEPTLADCAVVPVLDAMRATPRGTPLGRRVREDPQLSAYIDRGHAALAA